MPTINRALVVDDDPSWQEILSEILTDSGLPVDICDSLPTAVQQLHKTVYRLAVVDLSLGGKDHHNQDGLEVLQAIQHLQPSCMGLLLTGYADVELAVQSIQEYGAYTCLRKEAFRRVEFRETIRQALAAAPVSGTSAAAGRTSTPETDPMGSQPPASWVMRSLALVVEDDAGWRSLLAELLNDAGYQVNFSSSYGEALGLLKRHQFHLAVADISLASSLQPEGNLDGYRLLSSTSKADIPTIVVSGVARPDLVEQVYQEHAVFAFIEKQAFDRSAFLQTVNSARLQRPETAALELLSEREIETLNLLAQGLTNKEIAGRMFISTNTVKRHLKSIFEKLAINTRAAASAWAIRMGLGVKTAAEDDPARE
jgi:DNA-binding NarL/FixJ family response regulator